MFSCDSGGLRSASLAGVAGVLMSKDSSDQEFGIDYDKVYAACVEVLQNMGEISKEDKESGVISGKVKGSNISIKIERKDSGKTHVEISARKYMIPKPEIAGGLLYEISNKLK